jgi:uncharacterized membrane protein
MDIAINYWAVIVCAVANMVIGSLWYGPIFGRPWRKLMGITDESMKEGGKGMGARYAALAVASLVMAFILALFVQMALVVDVMGALQLAFWLWLGFIATVMLGTVLWEQKPVRLYILNIAYYLVTLSVQALILTYWV